MIVLHLLTLLINDQIINNRSDNNLISCKLHKVKKCNIIQEKIEIFDGSDVTKFKTFILNFERVIENKCDGDDGKIIYLEQYTSGQAGQMYNGNF